MCVGGRENSIPLFVVNCIVCPWSFCNRPSNQLLILKIYYHVENIYGFSSLNFLFFHENGNLNEKSLFADILHISTKICYSFIYNQLMTLSLCELCVTAAADNKGKCK